MPSYRVKVTVLKRVDPEYIFDGDVPNQPGKDTPYEICHHEEGKEWIVEKDGAMPEGFCSWAWRDLYKDLAVLRQGAFFDGWVKPPLMYTACTDGVRPVSFKLETLYED
ncbi:TIGR04076 family protein [Candidatus Bathyarchaeota archaeon]|jgi:uncharacterized repeat protein (TIGR04076 family)|nr:TIGR04076 family protein [Candidatus Bathyarchaeota archaeon]MBT4319531.1 TIGR04076 family protein [Candidatus Bathyarchaeota archaeon]MBT4422742.1 TIGR04076 family protein [Candidatus Bathyarchaeota archaeon]MBT6603476.1 TIGR04076 family protein [Candidatus Bathyarchaeota archaeon]MBT7186210.1 TIGR04076 family protein [Candidatus Bathyarchaeota archaeon]